MALELRQSLKMSQRIIMTPQLQQAIKFLQLSRLELCQTINQEMEANPLLEEIPDEEMEEGLPEKEEEEEPVEEEPLSEVTVKETIKEDFDWEAYISEYNTAWASSPHEGTEDRPSFENLISSKTNLYAHLMWQLQLSDLDEVHREIGRYIIGNIDPDGYLQASIENINRDAFAKKDEVSMAAREYIRDKLKSASWLVKSIQQRQRTIFKVTESIVKFQKGFFEYGPAHLKPMVLRNVAEDIQMHESTVSRVMNNKYMHSPFGIFELRYFLNSGVQSIDRGGKVASLSVKERIREIVKSEDKSKPYSDHEIANILKRSNIDIARRTVAKYREMLRIFPSNQRKNTYS